MLEPKTWIAFSKHLSGEESVTEKNEFQLWLNEDKKHLELFNKFKKLWDDPFHDENQKSFIQKYTKSKIRSIFFQKTMGNLIGFVIGMAVTNLFSHQVLEKKSIKNLFGLTKRKEILVNDIPEWLQFSISVLAGFIVLELINHMIETKKHMVIWNFIKNRNQSLKKN